MGTDRIAGGIRPSGGVLPPLPHNGVHTESMTDCGGEGAERAEYNQWANEPVSADQVHSRGEFLLARYTEDTPHIAH